MGTNGAEERALYSEVSWSKCMNEWDGKGVLFREVSS